MQTTKVTLTTSLKSGLGARRSSLMVNKNELMLKLRDSQKSQIRLTGSHQKGKWVASSIVLG
ncbi:hypothetical protein [Pleurocapsa sp. PCC 7319]|uniref:hypothetical protein n=1 Tax=Pleurocapsa sp. PCC 7319 TaxID=118161 RepID=UPI00036CE0E1|nr:hypothetical protein [Pleurocapsa sp. PCC 7319]